ncbi:MAG: ribbon-helix-helix protein, CopG family [Deltaproteobacteria bacterium]|nr:ribbon-helix-helix protein, CopG family [Deltaproteobacteria bacterium]
MSTVTVNISFQDRLLADIDRIAQRESRSRSELLREAARIYIERKERWNRIFAETSIKSSEPALTEKDVLDEISQYRSEKRK